MCGVGTAYPSSAPEFTMCGVGTAYPSSLPEFTMWGVGTTYPSSVPEFTMCGVGTAYPSSAPEFTMCGVGTAYPSGTPEFTIGFQWGSCYSIFSFLCSVLQIIIFFKFWPLHCLSFFNLRIFIPPSYITNDWMCWVFNLREYMHGGGFQTSAAHRTQFY